MAKRFYCLTLTAQFLSAYAAVYNFIIGTFTLAACRDFIFFYHITCCMAKGFYYLCPGLAEMAAGICLFSGFGTGRLFCYLSFIPVMTEGFYCLTLTAQLLSAYAAVYDFIIGTFTFAACRDFIFFYCIICCMAKGFYYLCPGFVTTITGISLLAFSGTGRLLCDCSFIPVMAEDFDCLCSGLVTTITGISLLTLFGTGRLLYHCSFIPVVAERRYILYHAFPTP